MICILNTVECLKDMGRYNENFVKKEFYKFIRILKIKKILKNK